MTEGGRENANEEDNDRNERIEQHEHKTKKTGIDEARGDTGHEEEEEHAKSNIENEKDAGQ